MASNEWDLPGLLAALEQEYEESGRHTAWQSEKASIENYLRRLNDRLCSRYSDAAIAGVGGSGIVLGLTDTQLANQRSALKFSRPSPEKLELLETMLEKEVAALADLRQTAIVRIHSTEQLPSADGYPSFSYYVMDFIDGKSSRKYFRDSAVTEAEFIGVVCQSVEAVEYLHRNGIAHLDLKPDNILIDGDGRPILADLGTAKVLSPTDPTETIVGTTQHYADQAFLHYLTTDPSDADRTNGRVPRSELQLSWDLPPFGATLLEWLGFDHKTGQPLQRKHQLSAYTRKYLLLMAARLLGDNNCEQWLLEALNLPPQVLKEFRYTAFSSVLVDVRKLTGQYSIIADVPELNAYDPSAIQVTTGMPTTFSHRLGELLAHPALRRLSSITQLGIVNQVYPTATHSRLEHSLGTYHNTCRLFLSLYNDPLSPFFKQVMNAPDACVALLCALLHDAGQFPLAHDLEEVDRGFGHDTVSKNVVRGSRDRARLSTDDIHSVRHSMRDLLDMWGVTPDEVVLVLDAKLETNAPGSIRRRLLHSMIDGPMDADKLDYLVRDSIRLGVPYGASIDVERILRSATVVIDPKATQGLVACVGVHEKAKAAAEFVTMARSAMYSQVYWQHSVRAMKAMLSRAMLPISIDLKRHGVTRRRNFFDEFGRFALSLPEALYYKRIPDAPALFAATDDDDAVVPASGAPRVQFDVGDISTMETTMAATDAAVILYFRSILNSQGLPEGELLADLLTRNLYKRYLVFSLVEGGPAIEYSTRWGSLEASQKQEFYRSLEGKLVEAVEGKLTDPDTVVITSEVVSRLRTRYDARRPIVLIDVPGERPGSTVPLYFVREAQRRSLRKDNRVIGDVRPSQAWNEFGKGLRARAGKLRIFVHPRFVDALEAAVPREPFLEFLNEALHSVAG